MQNKKYARNLRKLRGKISRQTVAEAIGVTRSAIAMYEQGERVPKDNIKVKLARFYNTTVEAIFYA
jgi:DNA-binding XRE family transcriptional regulator